MKTFAAFILLFVVAASPLPASAQDLRVHVQGPGHGAMVAPEPAKALEQMNRALARVEQLQDEVHRTKFKNQNKKTNLMQGLEDARLDIKAAIIELNNMPVGLPAHQCCPCMPQANVIVMDQPIQPPMDQPQDPMVVLDNRSFRELLSAVEDASFSSDKLGVIQTAADETYFTASQVKKIIEQLSFSADKLEALRILEDRITDRENAFKIISAFEFSSDKDEAKKILNRR